jgi:hypothetical protein
MLILLYYKKNDFNHYMYYYFTLLFHVEKCVENHVENNKFSTCIYLIFRLKKVLNNLSKNF